MKGKKQRKTTVQEVLGGVLEQPSTNRLILHQVLQHCNLHKPIGAQGLRMRGVALDQLLATHHEELKARVMRFPRVRKEAKRLRSQLRMHQGDEAAIVLQLLSHLGAMLIAKQQRCHGQWIKSSERWKICAGRCCSALQWQVVRVMAILPRPSGMPHLTLGSDRARHNYWVDGHRPEQLLLR